MTTKSKAMCRGCYDDFYNATRDGGCWNFATAEVVKRVEVGTFENPPYQPSRARDCLSCYKKQGSAFLKMTDSRVRDTPFPVEAEAPQ